MPTIPERLETATSLIEADTAKLNAIVNGGPTAPDVSTTGGAVKVIARIVAEGQAALDAFSSTASASATVATTQAGIATTKASEAATSAAGAVTAKDAAETAETAAETAQTGAQTARTAAEAARDAAAASQTAAAGSATAASGSAGTATTQAGNAATSAAAALVSQSAAAASATSAANSVAGSYLGLIAGNAIPATAPAAGRYYIISSAGTSQGITTAFGDWVIYSGTSGIWARLAAGVMDAASVARLVNPRASRQMLNFDGSAVRVEQTLPAAPGATDHAIAGFFQVPTANPAQNNVLYHLGTARVEAVGNELFVLLNQSGNFDYFRRGAGGADFRRVATANSVVSRFAGQIIFYEWSVAAGVISLRINGVAETLAAETTSGTPPAWTASLTGTLGSAGYVGPSAIAPNSAASLPWFFNRALTLAESVALMQTGAPSAADFARTSTGGTVPAQTNTLGTWAGSVVGPVYTINTASTGFVSGVLVAGNVLPVGRIRVGYTLTINSGPGPRFGDGTLYTSGALTGGGAAQSIEFSNLSPTAQLLVVNNFAAGNYVLTITSIVVLGLLSAPDANQPGRGPVWYDVSGNNAHWTLPASGVRWASPNSSRVTDLELAPEVNLRSARGGVAFDGSANSRAFSTLTGQNVATDPFAIPLTLRIPSANPSALQGLWYLDTSSTGWSAGVKCELNTDGTLNVYIGTAANRNNWNSVFSVVSQFGGKAVNLLFVRNASGNPSIYINGVEVGASGSFTTTGTPPTWQGSITSTFLGVGFTSAGGVYSGVIYSASLYNLALNAADALEISELGGAVPERFKFGSQAARYSSNFTVGVDGWAQNIGDANLQVTGNIDAVSGVDDTLRATAVGSNKPLQLTAVAVARNATYQLTFDYFAETACGLVQLGIGADNFRLDTGGVVVVENAWQVGRRLQFSGPTTALGLGGFNGVGVNTTINQLAIGKSLYLKNAVLRQLGAVCHFDGDSDGVGFQWHDQSSNKLDATLTTIGVSWTNPQRRGYVRGPLSWTATHEPKSLLGQKALPDGAVIDLLTLKASVASAGGATVGTTNAATRWRALAALGTTKDVSTLDNRIPATTAANDSDILVDPATSNFTGTIQVEAHYYLTEGV